MFLALTVAAPLVANPLYRFALGLTAGTLICGGPIYNATNFYNASEADSVGFLNDIPHQVILSEEPAVISWRPVVRAIDATGDDLNEVQAYVRSPFISWRETMALRTTEENETQYETRLAWFNWPFSGDRINYYEYAPGSDKGKHSYYLEEDYVKRLLSLGFRTQYRLFQKSNNGFNNQQLRSVRTKFWNIEMQIYDNDNRLVATITQNFWRNWFPFLPDRWKVSFTDNADELDVKEEIIQLTADMTKRSWLGPVGIAIALFSPKTDDDDDDD